MPKVLQPKRERIRFRRQAFVAANFLTYPELRQAVEEKLGEPINPSTFMQVVMGNLLVGPKAEAIMDTISKLTKKSVKELWPELEYAA